MTETITRVGQQININARLVATSCCACGAVFAIDHALEQQLRQTGKVFYCPNGHTLHYGEGENERLKKDLHRTEIERNTAKSNLTKFKNRVASGVCPCCKRYFANLHRHMTNQHPDYSKEGVVPEDTEGVGMENFKEWLSANEAAMQKGCLAITIVKALKEGRLRGHFDGHRWYVEPESLKAFRLWSRG